MPNYQQKTAQILDLAGIKIDGPRPFDLKVNNPKLYGRVFRHGSLGFGEAYMDGWWDVDSLDEFLTRIFKARLSSKIQPWTLAPYFIKSFLLNEQTRTGSKEVISHYNLSNEFYRLMLDPRMVYTCGYWRRAENLVDAQDAKLDLVCRKISLKKGDTVLDLGAGWGSFARLAAEKYGARVTAYNISKEQVEYTRKTTKDLSVRVVLADYRDAKGEYDKVVSIGVAEHIGYKNYGTFMQVIKRSLKNNPDSLALVHTIGNLRSVVNTDPWIEKYIFPNSMLPSAKQLTTAMEKVGLVMEDWHNFGADYDTTLMAWFKNFDTNWSTIQKLDPKFNERFYRMWKFYLLSSAALFRSRKGQLWQIVISKNGVPGGYRSLR